ncbi:MAG: glycosyltransferase [Lactobacillales bacterium]|nr:glycosyltransferase [Lactobacillales bacterium]
MSGREEAQLEEMKVSIILPTYNVADYLEECITSILKQTYQNWEAIFVNDGSTDDSVEIIRRYMKRDSRIRLISQKNSGAGIARNNGLKNALGQYICFADPDDFLAANLLESNLKMIQEHGSDLIMFDHFNFGRKKKYVNNQLDTSFFVYSSAAEIAKHFDELFNNFAIFAPWNKIYRSAFLKKHKIFFNDQKSGEDAFFNIKVFSKISSLIANPNNYYFYRQFREGASQTGYKKDFLLDDFCILNEMITLFDGWGVKNSNIIDHFRLHIYLKEKSKLTYLPVYKRKKLLKRKELKELEEAIDIQKYSLEEKIQYFVMSNNFLYNFLIGYRKLCK